MITTALIILLVINVVSFVYNVYIWRCDRRPEVYYAAEQKYQNYTKELHESVLNLNKMVEMLLDLQVEEMIDESKEEDKSNITKGSWTEPMYVHGHNNNSTGTITNVIKVKRKPGRPKKVKK